MLLLEHLTVAAKLLLTKILTRLQSVFPTYLLCPRRRNRTLIKPADRIDYLCEPVGGIGDARGQRFSAMGTGEFRKL